MNETKDIEEIVEEFDAKFVDREYFSTGEEIWKQQPEDAKNWLRQKLTTLTQHHQAEVERALEDVGNYVDELYQTGNLDKMQAEMLCEYVDEKLNLLPKPNITSDK